MLLVRRHLSTVLVGTQFEDATMRALERFGATLQRVGGGFDGGVDLAGAWLDNTRLVVQCKRQARLKVKSAALREFEAVLSHQRDAARTLGVFSSRSGFSVDAQQYFESMLPASALIIVDDDSQLRFFRMNGAARRLLPTLTSGVAYVTLTPSFGDKLGVGKRHAESASLAATRVVELFHNGVSLRRD